MNSYIQSNEFPSQRVSNSEKEKYEWYSACCDFIIAQGEAYRNSDWHFPIGMIDSLVYPNQTSVIYTDSIPLFAIFFKYKHNPDKL